MDWDLQEAVAYHRGQGAPAAHGAVVALLKEAQNACGGALSPALLGQLAEALGVKDSLLLAVVKRTPSLRLEGKHLLQLCAGPNCGRHTELERLARELADPAQVTVELAGCMRLCGKGPNLRYDGRLYHAADGSLLRRLLDKEGEG